MNDDRSLERAARSWAEQGPTRAPARAVDAALAQIETIRQDRDLPIPWRLPRLNEASRLVAGLATLVVVVAAGALILRPGTGTGGLPTPSPSPSPTLAVVPSPSPTVAACALLTTSEAANTYNSPGLAGLPGGGSGTGAVTSCAWSTGVLDVLVRVTYTTSGGRAEFDAVQGQLGVQVVANVGTDAVFDPATEILYLAKGDALVAILTGDPILGGITSGAQAARLAAETKLAKLIVNRM